MSRRTNNSRSNAPSTGRMPQIRLTFGGKSGRKHGAREITTLAKTTKKKKKPVVYSDDDDSTSGFSDDGFNEVDEESEEADDESEDPETDAPTHITTLRNGSGLPESEDLVEKPDNGEWSGFPEPKPDNVQIELFENVDIGDIEKQLFDSDNDDMVYERVNEVSDSDDDDDAIERQETELLTAEFNEDMTSHFANQIEGMSAYGFGSDSDEESVCFPFSSSDEANETTGRRVHFEEDTVGLANAFAVLADSPTMTRALLPSALPDSQDAEEPNADDYDSMYCD